MKLRYLTLIWCLITYQYSGAQSMVIELSANPIIHNTDIIFGAVKSIRATSYEVAVTNTGNIITGQRASVMTNEYAYVNYLRNYNTKGRIISYVTYRDNDAVANTQKYSYDSNGYPKEILSISNNKIYQKKVFDEYTNNYYEYSTYDSDGVLIGFNVFSKRGGNFECNSVGLFRIEYTYKGYLDFSGNITEFKRTEDSTGLILFCSFGYDSNGNVTSMLREYLNYKDELMIEYKYDKYKNWTTAIIYSGSGRVPVMIVKRTIQYYQ